MPTSSLLVRTSSREYSRYFDPIRVVTGYIITVGAVDGTAYTATLIREDGYGVVATKAGTMTAGKATVTFDLEKDCLDTDGIYRAKQGRYHIHVVMGDNQTAADSPTFDVMIVSVREFKQHFLRGIDLLASNVLMPRVQPTNVTGVTVDAVSPNHDTGLFTLAYTAAGTALSWAGGTPVTLGVGINSYTLLDALNSSYIDVTAVSDQFPAGNASDSIIIDRDHLGDDFLRQKLINTTGDLRGRLHTPLEPITLDTEDQQSPSYNAAVFSDEYVQPISYYRPSDPSTWLNVKFPYPNSLKLHRLEGWFQSTLSLTVPVDQWVVRNEGTGNVEFVPKQGALVAWQLNGVTFFSYMYAMTFIPSFWHFRLTQGIRALKGDNVRVRVRTALALWASLEVLVIAGQASDPSLTGVSISRDGVSESRSLANAKGGKYGNIIQQRSEFLLGADGTGATGELKSLRNLLVGIEMTTL